MSVRTPELLVENKFAAGRYRFELVVVYESGLESAPTELVVSVQAARRPAAPVEPVIERTVLRPTPTPLVTPVSPVSPVSPAVLRPTPIKKPK